MNTCVHLWYVAEFFLEWEVFQTKVVDKIKEYFYVQKTCYFWEHLEKYYYCWSIRQVGLLFILYTQNVFSFYENLSFGFSWLFQIIILKSIFVQKVPYFNTSYTET
jgi:hypothetical protein